MPRHRADDLSMVVGSVCVSAHGKVVTGSFDTGGYGNYVIIDHGGGYMTVYGHLRTRLVSVGQQVSYYQDKY